MTRSSIFERKGRSFIGVHVVDRPFLTALRNILGEMSATTAPFPALGLPH
jgi:hypothetical protein